MWDTRGAALAASKPRPLCVDPTRLVEAIELLHRDGATVERWLDGVSQALRLVCPELGVGMATVQTRGPERFELDALVSCGMSETWARRAVAVVGTIEASHLDRSVEGRLFDRASRWFPRRSSGFDHLWAFLGATTGCQDILGVFAQASGARLVSVAAAHPETVHFAKRDLGPLVRFALHFEVAARVRCDPSCLVAVLDAGGVVRHAEGEGRSPEVRDALQGHIARVERVRLRAARRTAESHELWPALVAGRYAMVEREFQGSREWWVTENPEHMWRVRSLDTPEALALEHAARGRSNVEIGYALGLSDVAVSRALGSASIKLGTTSVAQLVRLAASVVPHDLPPTLVALTPAEREIVGYLQRGWTNARIAAARGSSPHTVANQVAALLRKTGAGTRRALALLAPQASAAGRDSRDAPDDALA